MPNSSHNDSIMFRSEVYLTQPSNKLWMFGIAVLLGDDRLTEAPKSQQSHGVLQEVFKFETRPHIYGSTSILHRRNFLLRVDFLGGTTLLWLYSIGFKQNKYWLIAAERLLRCSPVWRFALALFGLVFCGDHQFFDWLMRCHPTTVNGFEQRAGWIRVEFKKQRQCCGRWNPWCYEVFRSCSPSQVLHEPSNFWRDRW